MNNRYDITEVTSHLVDIFVLTCRQFKVSWSSSWGDRHFEETSTVKHKLILRTCTVVHVSIT